MTAQSCSRMKEEKLITVKFSEFLYDFLEVVGSFDL
jgi:hypothetical protein